MLDSTGLMNIVPTSTNAFRGIWHLVIYLIICSTDLIFVTNITNYICGEKIAMWRIFSFPCMTIAGKSKISLHVEKFQMSSHDRCGKIWNSPHLACVWCRKRRHICKIYAIFLKNQFCQNLRILSRNPFCHNLRTFVWRKIYPKKFLVEKKLEISGLDLDSFATIAKYWLKISLLINYTPFVFADPLKM